MCEYEYEYEYECECEYGILTKALEHEHDIAKVCSRYLGNRILFQLIVIGMGSVESKTLSRCNPSSPPCAFVSQMPLKLASPTHTHSPVHTKDEICTDIKSVHEA